MNQIFKNVILVILAGLMLSLPLFAQNKLAQTGFQFLSVTPDARSASLADAMTTMRVNSAALWSNPASLAEMNRNIEVVASQNQWIADIDHLAVSAAYSPMQGKYGVFGLSFMYVDYGEVEGTIIADNEQGFIETGIIEPMAYAIGLGYAKRLSDKFSVGGHVKLVDQHLGPVVKSLNSPDGQNLDDNEVSVLAFDFGTKYLTGFRSLIFGMSVRNFSKEVRFAREGFQLPLTFNIGVSMNVIDFLPQFSEDHSFIFSVDATHPRSYPEFAKLGLEYAFLNTFFLRLGYMSNRDEEDITYGFGLHKFGLGVDYAYTPFGVFDKVQRFSINFSF
ncbi:MAG: PorV/PorQ family protein [Calditrichaeota bacterium]|nr:MAG: PorV/PorQ family protein [Calditrichota bacterium]